MDKFSNDDLIRIIQTETLTASMSRDYARGAYNHGDWLAGDSCCRSAKIAEDRASEAREILRQRGVRLT